jgi:hypothetical protein
MRNNISRKTVLMSCLTLVLQSSGMASLMLECGCLSPWGECGCTVPALASEDACCRAAVPVPACCETQDESQRDSAARGSRKSGCPCWQADVGQVAALSSSRLGLQPDSTFLSGTAFVASLSAVAGGERSSALGPVPVTPRFRLQSLLCVWII